MKRLSPKGSPQELAEGTGALSSRVRRGLLWSGLNNVVVRMASLAVGIVLARLLAPEDFGVFAVALTVQVVLVTLSELGISTDLIRRGDLARRGPTVATISMGASVTTTLLMVASAGPVAGLLGSTTAAPVVQVMSLTLLLSGFSVVPFARMQREFMQSRQLLVDASSLLTSTAVTVALVVLLDMGPMSLALGRIVGQAVTTALQIRITGIRPRFGWDAEVAREVLHLGLPVAAANLLSWAVLNIDNMLVGHALGATALGLYVLAFNLASWPMNAVGLTIRSVALPAFARLGDDRAALDLALRRSLLLTLCLAAPLGCLLVVFAGPAVAFLYGSRWSAAAPVLQALGAFGILRVAFDLFASFLYARGSSRPVLVVQVVWLMALVPGMLLGLRHGGLLGAAWAHVAVALAVLLPAYLVALRRQGLHVARLSASMLLPVLACAPGAGLALLATSGLSNPFVTLLVGGPVFLAVYAAVCARPVRGLVRRLRESSPGPVSSDPLTLDPAVQQT